MKKKLKFFVAFILFFSVILIISHKFVLKLYYPIKYYDHIQSLCEDTEVPVGFVYAIIHTESHFDSGAESHLGARGLMQITEETFEWVRFRKNDLDATYDDLYDPYVNIRYGVWLLELLFEEFDTPENVMCAYHAGWGSVQNWLLNREYAPDGVNIATIPYKDTAHYVYKVKKAWKQYNNLYNLK